MLAGPRRWLWAAAWPVRAYVKWFPVQRGKGVLQRRVLFPILGNHATFEAELPPRGRVRLNPRDAIGWTWLIHGAFESAELHLAGRLARQGGWVLDVGGNVGVFSVAVGQCLAPGARMITFEPVPGNVARLRDNLARSGVRDVEIVQVAAAARAGEADLLSASDSAYSGLVESADTGDRRGMVVRVPLATIDSVWAGFGSPPVSLMKLDIEGGELEALRGALRLLGQCRPVLIVEAPSPEQLERLQSLLAPLGYVSGQPAGFEPWNYVFRARGAA